MDQLRRAALATDGSLAHEIRLGVQLRLEQLRRDPEVVARVKSKRDELQRLIDDLQDGLSEDDVAPAGDRPSTGAPRA